MFFFYLIARPVIVGTGLLIKLLYEEHMKSIKLIILVIFFSALSSFLTWKFVQGSYDAGYEMIGNISNAGVVKLNTRILKLDNDKDAKCHMAKHTRWMVDDLRKIEVPNKYIIGGPNLPKFTKAEIEEAIAAFESAGLSDYASICETTGKLF